MLHQQWNTSNVDRTQRFDYYRSGLCAAFAHLTPQPGQDRSDFKASLHTWMDAEHEVSMLSATSHPVSRTQHDLSQAQDNHLYLNYIVKGEMRLAQGDLRAKLGPGQFVLIDNARPFDVEIDAERGHCHLTLKMPQTAFNGAMRPGPEELSAHPLAPMLKSALAYFSAKAPGQDIAFVEPMIASVWSLCESLVKTRHVTQQASQSKATYEAVNRLVRQHFRDAEFDFHKALASLPQSGRTIQHHLQSFGTNFSEMLRHQRLASAYQEIIARKSGECIEQICYRNGYAELSAFYRAFKERYGFAPGSLGPTH